MVETKLIEPLPLIWKGHYDDIKGNDQPDWKRGWAFFSDPGKYAVVKPVRPGLKRLPIVVLCPMGEVDARHNSTPFCIDSPSTMKSEYWEVEVDESTLIVGQKPRITVRPSIHLLGIWHGWLTEGELIG